MKDGDVILVLAQVGRNFCTYLSSTIIPQNMRETITYAQNSAAALGNIRDVSFYEIT